MEIEEILSELKVEFAVEGNHHCRPGWVQLLDCPFCGSSKYHLGYNVAGNYFNCWNCGAHHTISVLCRLGLAHDTAEEFWKGEAPRRRSAGPKLRTGLKEPENRGKLLRVHKEYLRSRGFDPEEIARIWEVEGIGLASRLAWRLYIPITIDGRRVSWTTRAIGESIHRRYVSASPEEESINHKHTVYGSDYCNHSIVIVEGPTDAWKIGPGAGCLFGTAFSSAQVRRLINYPYRYVCFDSSADAQRKAKDLCAQLAPFDGETVNLQIDAKDPGSASDREIRLIRKVSKL